MAACAKTFVVIADYRWGKDVMAFHYLLFFSFSLLPSLTVMLSPLVQQAIGLPWAEGIGAC